MKSSEESILFFRFLKENAVLFTSCTLFAAFFYYVVTLLKEPKSQMNNLNATIFNTAYSQQTAEIRGLLDQVFSLQYAAVISFLIFATILISIIFIAFRYDIFTKIFGLLLGLLLFYSFIYLLANFKEAIYGMIAILFPLAFFLIYVDFMDSIREKYQKEPSEQSTFCLFWFSTLGIMMILLMITWGFISYLLTFVLFIELVYFVLFLIFWLLVILFCIMYHLFSFILFFIFKKKKRTLVDYDVI
jgi:hypothetical protein